MEMAVATNTAILGNHVFINTAVRHVGKKVFLIDATRLFTAGGRITVKLIILLIMQIQLLPQILLLLPQQLLASNQ